ncbi:efflux RND transporter periplasmic adaptor subunit [Methylomonas sp. HYX-M1]|uniref:efflux RND transporter periplasmic adaptor subunit n=1 Tax=Methylomonas sp. HYX-M1 TaxID=3139307 RepID=UPI00345B88E8
MNDHNSPDSDDIADVLGMRPTPSQPLRKGLAWLLALALGLAIWLALNGESETVAYQTESARRGTLSVTVSATGTLAPLKEVQVGIEVSGTIKSVEVDYNDQVEVGQVLARLDTTRLEAQSLQAQAALAAAKAKVQQVQATVKEAEVQLAKLLNVRELSGGKVPSQYDLDAAEATLARARADQASATASVEQAQGTLNVNLTDLTKAVVKSPINGVVLTRSVEPGQTVASQFQAPVLFTLAEDLTQMELQVDVDEADVGLVKPGQHAEFSVDAYPDRTFPAEIVQVRYGAETVDGVVTYKTVLRVDNAELSLRPGMTATAIITVERHNDALLIPNGALRFTPPKPATEDEANGGILGALLPHPPRSETGRAVSAASDNRQTLWTLQNGNLTAVEIDKGASDGRYTEVVSGNLPEGAAIVTGLASKP